MEFDTSVICHVFMHCIGSFLLQAMSLNVCFQGTKYEINREDVDNLHCVVNLRCDAGPGCDKNCLQGQS